ncbi:hypothetical protein ACQ4PT_023856 [Festuca glaucescens]
METKLDRFGSLANGDGVVLGGCVQPGKLNAIFPMRFRDDTDLAVATSFFQELQDAGNSYSKAPKCSWSAIPPPELRGESVHHLTTNGGFVSFDILERHVKRRRAAKTAWILLNFQSYVKYHIKCTRSYIQSRMRKRQERLTEVIQDARLRGSDNTKKLQVRKKSKRRLISLGKAKKLQKGFRAVVDRMKRLRLWIRVRALDRLRRHYRQCFAVPRVKGNKYYDKLEVLTKGWGDIDPAYATMLPALLLRMIHNQIWISLSRHQTARRKHIIVDRSLEFEQVDRESSWDDQIIFNGLFFYMAYVAVPNVSRMPVWRTEGAIITALLHIGPVEFLYYWFHRALHHHFLYSRYHSHHHASIVTEPITSVIHPFAEHVGYFVLFSIPLMTPIFMGCGSVLAVVLYITYIDFMNNMGHCNFELVIMNEQKEYDMLKSRVPESSTVYLKFTSDEIPQYLVLAPAALQTAHRMVTKGWGDIDLVDAIMLSGLLLRLFLNQVWISLSRYHTARRKHIIVDRSLEFEQVDRERSWDDQVTLAALTFYLAYAAILSVRLMPEWETKGGVIMALLHIGPVEFLYYWFHRALHHHFLYSRYHSHHHASIVTEPLTYDETLGSLCSLSS